MLKHYQAPALEELDETLSDEHEASAVEESPPPPLLPIIDNDGHERFIDFIEFQTYECVSDDKDIYRSIQNRVQMLLL